MARVAGTLILENAGDNLKPRNKAMAAILEGAQPLGESRYGTAFFRAASGRLIKRTSGRARFVRTLPGWLQKQVQQAHRS